MSADEVTELRAEIEQLRQEVEQRTGMRRAALARSEERRQENNRLHGELVAVRAELNDVQVRANDLDYWIAEGKVLEARIDAVVALHYTHPVDGNCGECGQPVPCDSVRAATSGGFDVRTSD